VGGGLEGVYIKKVSLSTIPKVDLNFRKAPSFRRGETKKLEVAEKALSHRLVQGTLPAGKGDHSKSGRGAEILLKSPIFRR